MGQLELEFVNFDAAAQRFSHYATGMGEQLPSTTLWLCVYVWRGDVASSLPNLLHYPRYFFFIQFCSVSTLSVIIYTNITL